MRALFIKTRSRGSLPWTWLALALLLLAGWALMSLEWPWAQSARSLIQPWWSSTSNADASRTLTEPVTMPATTDAPPPGEAAPTEAQTVAPAQAPQEEAIEQQVQAFVSRWVASWSAKNLEDYFSCYADDFQPEGRKSVADWAKERKQKISSKSKISVQIQDFFIVSSDHSGLKVSFTQIYEADTFRSTSPKVLLLKNQNSDWKIIREYTP